MDSITLTLRAPGARARWTAAGIAAGLLMSATFVGPAVAPQPARAADPG